MPTSFKIIKGVNMTIDFIEERPRRIVIAGYRHFHDYKLFCKYLNTYPYEIKRIAEGECQGTDQLAKRYAKENDIEWAEYPANWNTYGNRAGPMRNVLMLHTAQDLIVFRDKKSIGTKDIIKKAKILNVNTIIWDINYNRRKKEWEIVE